MRLSLRLLYWLLIALAMYAAFAYFRLAVLRLFLLASLALLLFSLVQVIWNYYMLDAAVRVGRALIPRGGTARWFLKLKNKSRITTLPVRVSIKPRLTPLVKRADKRSLLGNIAINGEAMAVLSVSAKHCGVLHMDSLKIAVGDLFGFFYLTLPVKRIQANEAAVYVLPLAVDNDLLAEESLLFMEGVHKSKRPFEESEELDQLRSLQAGDPLKRIHWKISARVNDWMVKQYKAEDDTYWTMLCDVQIASEVNAEQLQAGDYALALRDHALDTAAALIESVFLERKKLELKTYHPQPRALKAGEIVQYPLCLKQLADLPLQASLSLAEQIRLEIQGGSCNPYIILCTSLDTETLELLQLFLLQKVEIFLVMIPWNGKISPEQSRAIDKLRLEGLKLAISPYVSPDVETPDNTEDIRL